MQTISEMPLNICFAILYYIFMKNVILVIDNYKIKMKNIKDALHPTV